MFMNILIAGSVIGDYGTEESRLITAVATELEACGHRVDSFLLPFERDMLSVIEQCSAYQLLDVSSADLLITIGFPACMINHPNKRVYLFESLPAYNEYWDTEYGVLSSPQYNRIRKTIFLIERQIIQSSKLILTNSKLLAQDYWDRHQYSCECYYFPLENEMLSLPSEFESQDPFLIMETSLLPHQRFELAIEAMLLVEDIVLNVFVSRTQTTYWDFASQLIKERGAEKRIRLFKGTIPQELIENASGYLHVDFESRRIPAIARSLIEAGCPIIAPVDCGAMKELIVDSKRGKCTGGKPEEISSAISKYTGQIKKMNSFKMDEQIWSLKSLVEGLVKS
jgi:hypothetical protein